MLGPCRVSTNYLSGPPSAQGSGPCLQPGRQGTSCCLLCLKADGDPLGAEVQPVSAAALPGQCVLGAPGEDPGQGVATLSEWPGHSWLHFQDETITSSIKINASEVKSFNV